MNKSFRLLLVTALSGITASAGAATTKSNDPCDGKLYVEDGRLCTVITANRFEQPISTVGSSISVITHEEMERRGVKNVAEALRRTPGASFAQTGGFGSITNIRLRGSDSGQVTVLVDGVKVNDPTNTEGFYDFGQLLTNNIERIEILRGPQSSLYGADTTGGVINIITKESAENRTEGFAEAGSHQTFNNGLSRTGNIGGFTYGISGQRFMTQGFSRIAAGTEDDHTRVEDLKAHVRKKVNDNLSFKLSGGASHSKADLDGFAADEPGFSTGTTYYGVGETKLKLWDGKVQNSLSLSHFIQNRKSNEPVGFFRFSTFDGERTEAHYQTDVALRTRDVFTIGADYRLDQAFINTTSGGVTATGIDTDTDDRAVFSQYVLGITDNWTATLAGRHDKFESFGNANTYRATTAYNIPETNTTLRSSYGTGFKAPSLFQLYSPLFGTPTLQPEESIGYDAGIEQRFLDKRLTLNVTAFRSKYKNLITFDTGTFTYQNINRASTRGMEGSASYAVLPELLLTANHTYLLSQNDATRRSLPRRPKHSGSLAADLDIGENARIGAELLYTTSMWDRETGLLRDKSHATVNLTGSIDLNKDVTLYSNLNNIFNHNYQDIAGYNTPGFEAFVGVRGGF